MPEPLIRHRLAPLRLIALRLSLPDLETVARRPDVIDALRLTIQYHDNRALDQVTTILKVRAAQAEPPRLSAAYRRLNDKPLVLDLRLDEERYTAFAGGLRKVGFDKLDDMPDIPWIGADLWLLERASGTFYHDVIVAPEHAKDNYADIVRLVRENLREAVRMLNP